MFHSPIGSFYDVNLGFVNTLHLFVFFVCFLVVRAYTETYPYNGDAVQGNKYNIMVTNSLQKTDLRCND